LPIDFSGAGRRMREEKLQAEPYVEKKRRLEACCRALGLSGLLNRMGKKGPREIPRELQQGRKINAPAITR